MNRSESFYLFQPKPVPQGHAGLSARDSEAAGFAGNQSEKAFRRQNPEFSIRYLPSDRSQDIKVAGARRDPGFFWFLTSESCASAMITGIKPLSGAVQSGALWTRILYFGQQSVRVEPVPVERCFD